MMRIRVLLIVAVVLILSIVGTIVLNKAQQAVNKLPYYSQVSAFEFTNQDSQPYTEAKLIGKYSIVDFMFTRCHGPCPIMTSHMETLYKLFENNNKIQLLSISVDPDYDSVAVLKAYADLHKVTDNRWQFIRNDMAEVIKLCETGFKLAADDLPGAHTTKFILVDPAGYIRGYYNGTEQADINKLIVDMNTLLSEES